MLTPTRLVSSGVLASIVACCGLGAQGKWQFRAAASNPRADSPAGCNLHVSGDVLYVGG